MQASRAWAAAAAVCAIGYLLAVLTLGDHPAGWYLSLAALAVLGASAGVVLPSTALGVANILVMWLVVVAGIASVGGLLLPAVVFEILSMTTRKPTGART